MSDIGNLEMDTKESLERELHSFRDEVLWRLDPQAGRCEAILCETGRRWSGGMVTWAAKIEADQRQACRRPGQADRCTGWDRAPADDSLTLNFFDKLKRRVPVGGK
jgi:hypothetical protein